MADTYSALLRFRKQQTGANENTWGGLLNTAAIQLIEDAIAGAAEITVAGSDITLTTANGANDQARKAILWLTGAPGAARNIIIPQLSKLYVVINETGSTMTVMTSASGAETVAVEDGVITLLVCDGENVIEVSPQSAVFAGNAGSLGGIPAASYARLDQRQGFDGGQMLTPVALTMGATVTPDMSDGNIFTGTLTTNTAIAVPTSVDATFAQPFQMVIRQAAAGGPYSVTFDSFFDFLGQTPSMPSPASSILYVRGVIIPSLAKAICVAEAQSASTVSDIIFSANEENVDMFRRMGSPAGIVNVTITVDEGVVISSRCPNTPALDFSQGFASGSTINLVNLGFIVGCGGRGGQGGIAFDGNDSDDDFNAPAEDGLDGGDAIRAPGAGITFNITNADGRIWGGGGGGGGGGSSIAGAPQLGLGGGGGGGAGYGQGGPGNRWGAIGGISITRSSPGADGSILLDGSDSGGTGGAAATSGGSASNGADGGDFGAAGGSGGGTGGGTGGAAGKAIDLTGASPTFVNGSGSPNVKGAVS